jgi:hypothetical protein
MSATISAERLIEASNHALVRVHEFDGAGVDAKLAIFGLESEAVRDLLEDRWIEYRRCGEGDDYYLFVRAMVEGLLTGMQLAQ